MRVMQWDTDTGVVTLTWPDELSEEVESGLNIELDRPNRKRALKNWDWKTATPMEIGRPFWKEKPKDN